MTQFGLSRRQRQALDALVAFKLQHRRMPTTSELAVALGNRASSKGGACQLLQQLEERGWIRRAGNKHGAIAFVNADARIVDLRDELKRHVLAQLDAFCRISGETPGAVINDALVHFFDHEAGPYADDAGRIAGSLVAVTVSGGPA